MAGNVLVIGGGEDFSDALDMIVLDAQVHGAVASDEVEGRGVDVVVIAGPHPFDELGPVRVHPTLHDKPVVIAAPGRTMAGGGVPGVYVVTSSGERFLEDLVERVSWLLARATHPARGRDPMRAAS